MKCGNNYLPSEKSHLNYGCKILLKQNQHGFNYNYFTIYSYLIVL